MTIDQNKLDELRKLAMAATPDWIATVHDGELLIATPSNEDGTYYCIAERIGGRRKGEGFKDRSEEFANWQLIVAMRNNILTLIDLAQKALPAPYPTTDTVPPELRGSIFLECDPPAIVKDSDTDHCARVHGR